MSYLVLVRHGESRWNKFNKFTGWVDVPLTENGIDEALRCAKELRDIEFDMAFTSLLKRAQETLLLILSDQDRTGIFMHKGKKRYTWSYQEKQFEKNDLPVFTSEDLNERYYGSLQGMNKDKAVKKFGKDQVFNWRRSFKSKPPQGESLQEASQRIVPYFNKNILKEVKSGKNVLVSAHGNSLRAIIKSIEKISDDEIPFLELPEGKPVIYKYSKSAFKMTNHVYKFDRPLR